jgi:hypothetical protein
MQRESRYIELVRFGTLQMNAKTKALSEEARRLSPDERIELIEEPIPSIRKSIDSGPKKRAMSRRLSSRRVQSEALRGHTQEVPTTVTIRFVEAAEAELGAALATTKVNLRGLALSFLLKSPPS